MSRAFKLLLYAISGLLLIALFIAAVGTFVLMRSVQPAAGEAVLAGLAAPVTVVRDRHAIPHIVAQTNADAAAALGFAHAQDRIWQMETLRMTAQGRLSELFGENEAVQNIDIFLRSLGFLEQSRSSLDALKDEDRRILEAYAAGVNRFLTRQTRMLEPSLPPEFLILGHTPEPWEPAHSLLVLKLMSLQLSMNMSREIGRLALAAHGLNSAEIGDVMPAHKTENPPPLPDLREIYRLTPPERTGTEATEFKPQVPVDLATGIFASNNWVWSGERTETGAPILANDPHLAFTSPGLWYLAHLSWQGKDGQPINTIGATIPAVPAVILGRNDRIAWGFTNAGADVQDLFIEQINEDDPSQYLTPDGWAAFETREETIKVKGGEDIVVNMRRTRHGPVLPDTFSKVGDYLADDYAVSLRWTGLNDRDGSFGLLSQIAEAKSVSDFADVVVDTVSPMQAMVVADVDGDIGLFARAHVPLRSPENRLEGRAPAPGWLAEYDWQGLVPPLRLPAVVNPANGALGTANSRFMPTSYREFLTYDWDEAFRHDRVQETMVNTNEKASIALSRKGQLDDYSPALVAFRDLLLAALPSDYDRALIRQKLVEWDGRMDMGSETPLLVHETFRQALKGVFEDDLGPVMHVVGDHQPASALLRVVGEGGARDWCDRRDTARHETCDEVMTTALDAALASLEERLDGTIDDWSWGAVHQVRNEHRPFSQVWPLSKLFEIRRPISGGSYTLLRAKPNLNAKDPYQATHGAGYRAVYDLGDWSNSIYIQTTGQSGNPFSPFYDDMADLWAKGDYLPIEAAPSQYEREALGTWMLMPPDQEN